MQDTSNANAPRMTAVLVTASERGNTVKLDLSVELVHVYRPAVGVADLHMLRPAFPFPGRRILVQGRHAEIGI